MENLTKKITGLKPVRGQKLENWLRRFLVASPEDLAKWQGTFTEVMTAKVVSILRKRGVVEELEVREETFSKVLNAAYRVPVKQDRE